MRLRGVFCVMPPVLNSDGTLYVNRDDVQDRPELKRAIDQHSKFTMHTSSFQVSPPSGEEPGVFHGYVMEKGEMFEMRAFLLRNGFVEDSELIRHRDD